MPDSLPIRQQVLASLGASEQASAELLRYNTPSFDLSRTAHHQLLVGDEPFVSAWREYAREVSAEDSILPLARYLVQFRFPIEAGISTDPAYIEATTKGAPTETMPRATGIVWHAPQRVRLLLHPSLTGTLPVLIAEEREDFVSLVRALSRRNEPASIPDSMGACMIAGYRNWHRLCTCRQPLGAGDRFILLSSGDYSAIPAHSLGLSPQQWRSISVRIRLEHECIHYATRRLFGSMKNAIFDELLADSFALFRSTGQMNQDWLLRFLGLEQYPLYRAGGRLENYRGRPQLSDPAFAILQALVIEAAAQLHTVFATAGCDPDSTSGCLRLLVALAHLSLEELAAPDACTRTLEHYNRLSTHAPDAPALYSLHPDPDQEAHL